MGRAIRNGAIGYFQQGHYLGALPNGGNVLTVDDTGQSIPLDPAEFARPIGRTIRPSPFPTRAASPVVVPTTPIPVTVPIPPDMLPPILPIDLSNNPVISVPPGSNDGIVPIQTPPPPPVIVTPPSLTPTSAPVATISTPPPPVDQPAIVTTITPPSLTPSSAPVPTVTTTPVSTPAGSTAASTTTTAPTGTVSIFGMNIPTTWLWIGGGLIVLWFLFGGHKKR